MLKATTLHPHTDQFLLRALGAVGQCRLSLSFLLFERQRAREQAMLQQSWRSAAIMLTSGESNWQAMLPTRRRQPERWRVVESPGACSSLPRVRVQVRALLVRVRVPVIVLQLCGECTLLFFHCPSSVHSAGRAGKCATRGDRLPGRWIALDSTHYLDRCNRLAASLPVARLPSHHSPILQPLFPPSY